MIQLITHLTSNTADYKNISLMRCVCSFASRIPEQPTWKLKSPVPTLELLKDTLVFAEKGEKPKLNESSIHSFLVDFTLYGARVL